jgi:hypothetical protein
MIKGELRDNNDKVFYSYDIIKLGDDYQIEVHEKAIELVDQRAPDILLIGYDFKLKQYIFTKEELPPKIVNAFRMFVANRQMKKH